MISYKLRDNSAHYFGLSSLILVGSNLASNILVIRWLQPYETGIWQTLRIFSSYYVFIQLGFFSGLNREYPYLIGKGEKEQAIRLVSTTSTVAVIGSLFALALTLISALCVHSADWTVGILAIGISTASSFYFSYLTVTFRTGQDFIALSKLNLWQSFLLLVSVPIVAIFGFDGMCIRLAFTSILGTMLAFIWRPIRLPIGWHWPSAKQLLAVGFPIMSLGYITVLAESLDRVVVLLLGGVEAVGLFAPAMMVKTAMVALPAATNQYISPKISMSLGAGATKEDIWPIAWRAVLWTSLILVAFAIVGLISVPPAFRILFPAYISSTGATQLVFVASIFLSIQAGTAVLPSTKAWLNMFGYGVTAAVLLFLLPYLFAVFGDNLLCDVAVGLIVARALMFITGLVLIRSAANRMSLSS